MGIGPAGSFQREDGKAGFPRAYGLLGKEMIRWVTQLQYIRGRNVWFVGLLDAKRDDFNREFFEPQIEGAKTGLELPGIVDQVVTMTELRTDDGAPVQGVCLFPAQPVELSGRRPVRQTGHDRTASPWRADGENPPGRTQGYFFLHL